MTNDEAYYLKPGEFVYTASWSQSLLTAPTIQRLQYAGKGDYNKLRMTDGSLWVSARLHRTKTEARQYISGLIYGRLTKLQSLLKEWEAIQAADDEKTESDIRLF